MSALVDSGADVSIMDIHIAEMLGFDFKGKPFSGYGRGAGGAYKYWQLPNIETVIEGHGYQFPFVVIQNPNNIWPCILGQKSIFRVAKITFEAFEQQFELSFRTDLN